MKARTLMSRPAHTCRLDTTLDEASRSMAETAYGALVVLDDADRLAGIVTDRDLAMAIGSAESDPSRLLVAGTMTANVRTCLPDDNLAVALERMSDEKVRRLPVVDAEGTVEGMLSIDDIILWGARDVAASRGRRSLKRCARFVLRTTRCSKPRTSRSARPTLTSSNESSGRPVEGEAGDRVEDPRTRGRGGVTR